MGKRVQGKVCLVLGATSGIGRAAVARLAEEGGRIVFGARRAEKGKEFESQLKNSGYEVEFIQTDVTKSADLQHIVDATIKKYGRIDVLFNNAGVSVFKPFLELTMDEYDKIQNLNMRSYFESCKLVVPYMVKQKSGSIINTSSIGGIVGSPLLTAYSASKGAVRLFTKALASELGEYNVRVNSLHPGLTMTEMTEGQDEFIKIASAIIPMKRAASATEIANGVVFLASDESSFMSGSELVIDGGATAI